MKGLLNKLFSQHKPILRAFEGIGEFEFNKSGEDSCWQTESPVLNLPPEFDSGMISGDELNMDIGAMKRFKEIAQKPNQLFDMLTEEFLAKAHPHFNELTLGSICEEFYIKSISISNQGDYEFGLHSRSKDIFIESFVRSGELTEVYIDEGCCNV